MVDFGKMKDLYKLQKQAREIQRELRDTEIEARSNDDWVTVVFNGEQHLQEITLADEALRPENRQELEKQLVNTISQAISRSQALAAEKMKSVMGDMGLPGM